MTGAGPAPATVSRAPAKIFYRQPGASIESVFKGLEIVRVSAVLMIISGAQGEQKPAESDELRTALRRGLASSVSLNDILTLDGGTASGPLGLLDQALASSTVSARIGVAPLSQVAVSRSVASVPSGDVVPQSGSNGSHNLGASHTHFVLTPGQTFGDETETMFELADFATEKFQVPVVVLLINGGKVARRELGYALRRRWTVVALQDTRRLADTVSRLVRPRGIWRSYRLGLLGVLWLAGRLSFLAPERVERWLRGRISTRLSQQDVEIQPVHSDPEDLENILSWHLEVDSAMASAWSTFARFDHAADFRQHRYFTLLFSSLILGLVSTAAAIAKNDQKSTFQHILDWILVIVPATAAIATTLVARLSQDRQWVALRSAAEQVQREIYRYRGGTYANDIDTTRSNGVFQRIANIWPRALSDGRQRSLLASRLELIGQSLDEQSVDVAPHASASRMRPLRVPREAFSTREFLTTDRYVEVRLDDQLKYFAKRARRMLRQLTTWIAIPPVLAVGAAILLYEGQYAWTVLISVGVTAVSAWYQSRAIRESLAQGNEAVIKLQRIRGDWLASKKKRKQMDLRDLVDRTETILERENAGWVGSLEARIRENMRPENLR